MVARPTADRTPVGKLLSAAPPASSAGQWSSPAIHGWSGRANARPRKSSGPDWIATALLFAWLALPASSVGAAARLGRASDNAHRLVGKAFQQGARRLGLR